MMAGKAADGLSAMEEYLCRELGEMASSYNYRFEQPARRYLLRLLFRSLCGFNDDYLHLLFPKGVPTETDEWNLSEAQDAVQGAEYLSSARGKACGHIFRANEATFRCKTCSSDDTCVLCSRCFESSDHSEHLVTISVSSGNSGCCDCGDPEAWRLPMNCAIHTAYTDDNMTTEHKEQSRLPDELRESIQMTMARVLDFICDVISYSPEHLRLPKTEDSIRNDEKESRFKSACYGQRLPEEEPEFALILWNDEKHTVPEVEHQVSRACRETKKFGKDRASETHEIGRSVVRYSKDVKHLLEVCTKIEQIKVTCTIRSARDVFHEQMCGSIIEWLMDIAGCSFGSDDSILRQAICEQLLNVRRTGPDYPADVGGAEIDDIQKTEEDDLADMQRRHNAVLLEMEIMNAEEMVEADENDDEDDDDDQMEVDAVGLTTDSDDPEDRDQIMGDVDQLAPSRTVTPNDGNDMTTDQLAPSRTVTPNDGNDMTTNQQAPAPLAVPFAPESSTSDIVFGMKVPKTPNNEYISSTPRIPNKWWLEKPRGYVRGDNLPPCEDMWQRVRLDWLILYDLRLWKKARQDLKDLYISTIVLIPGFKRLLGLRFAALFTNLAQLYLIADREPEHTILQLSTQMLTTPSITEEIVEQGNFLTNLLAILYTFLTTRQVGHPHQVDRGAVLSIDGGTFTNRRLYRFFQDVRVLLVADYVQKCLREEERYGRQFLDLVYLHQGACPTTRATGEHVEFEADTWISAAVIMRELNRLCRHFADSFRWRVGEENLGLKRTLRISATASMNHSLGSPQKSQSNEIMKFKTYRTSDYNMGWSAPTETVNIVDFTVDSQSLSFYHPLHYTLSWLVECAKSLSAAEIHSIFVSAVEDLQRQTSPENAAFGDLLKRPAADVLLGMFDYPLRVYVWVVQIRIGMWVRNGLSLRHQMQTYKGVGQREFTFNRDIALLQCALVVCRPETVLLNIIDRFRMDKFVRGDYSIHEGWEAQQQIDVTEDFLHLLITLLSDRHGLFTVEDSPKPLTNLVRREIAHVLCFKPLPFSELQQRIPDKAQEQESFQEILAEMTNFKQPEGISDSGVFELKDKYLSLVDPYVSSYSKNQREESETAIRTHIAKTTGRAISEVVFEPTLGKVHNGVFKDIGVFSQTLTFTQIIFYSLLFAINFKDTLSDIPESRIETFLHYALHLTLLAVIEDEQPESWTPTEWTAEVEGATHGSFGSFVHYCLQRQVSSSAPELNTVAKVLNRILSLDRLKSCHPSVKLILQRMREKRPHDFQSAVPSAVAIPQPPTMADNEDEVARKKRLAKERQAKIMASFQQQQLTFLDQAGAEFADDDFSDMESENLAVPEHRKVWKYPSGTCILCQEDTNDTRLFGTFGLLIDTNVLRQTDLNSSDSIMETITTPQNLDESAERIRPFGISGANVALIKQFDSYGREHVQSKSILGGGFTANNVLRGPVSTGCGHIMHFSCFERYCESTSTRHQHQIAREHPERLTHKEFVCPLCKALGNSFLPIIWKHKEESYPGVLASSSPFGEWLHEELPRSVSKLGKRAEEKQDNSNSSRFKELFQRYNSENMVTTIGSGPVDGGPFAQALPHFLPDDSASLSQIAFAQPFTTLTLAMSRLKDTIKVNDLGSRYTYPPPNTNPAGSKDLLYTDTLAKAFGMSISCAEISQRGVQTAPGSLLLETVPQSTLTHLRILSETAFSYISIGVIQNNTSKTTLEFSDTQSRQIHQLFTNHLMLFREGELSLDSKHMDPLFIQDVFIFLAECSVCLVPSLKLDIHHIMQLCFIAEIVKVLFVAKGLHANGVMGNLEKLKTISEGDVLAVNKSYDEAEMSSFANFVAIVLGQDAVKSGLDYQLLRLLVDKYALPFLRKSVILLHTRYGVDFSSLPSADNGLPELDRLTRQLNLMTLPEIFTSFTSDSAESAVLQSVAAGWIRHWLWYTEGVKRRNTLSLSLSHPTILELVGLPNIFDTLMEEATKRRCPSTGKDLSDPSVCLFCGEIFCSQAICCMKKEKDIRLGGCNQHMKKCGIDVGIFINIRKCVVLYLHGQQGSWNVAPYLDKYGEIDPGLRRNRQLFLNQKRYDALLRTVWLNHNIPTTISRKLEADINNGGWESL